MLCLPRAWGGHSHTSFSVSGNDKICHNRPNRRAFAPYFFCSDPPTCDKKVAQTTARKLLQIHAATGLCVERPNPKAGEASGGRYASDASYASEASRASEGSKLRKASEGSKESEASKLRKASEGSKESEASIKIPVRIGISS